jgi:dihydrofolate reductase
MSRSLVFIASSLDGFIAGPNDELDWLAGGKGEPEDTFTPFMAHIGAMLMGRRTFDVVRGFGGSWPYGETPVLVATHRPLTSTQPTVRAVRGTVAELIDEAKAVAGERDVYVDGGALIRSALDAELIDEMTVTMIPIVLGEGIPLFAGASRQHRLELLGARDIGGGLVQLRYRPRR